MDPREIKYTETNVHKGSLDSNDDMDPPVPVLRWHTHVCVCLCVRVWEQISFGKFLLFVN